MKIIFKKDIEEIRATRWRRRRSSAAIVNRQNDGPSSRGGGRSGKGRREKGTVGKEDQESAESRKAG